MREPPAKGSSISFSHARSLCSLKTQRRQGRPGQKHKPIGGTSQQGIRAVGVKLYPSAPLPCLCMSARRQALSECNERAREEVLVFQSRDSLSPRCSWHSHGSLDSLQQHCEHAPVVCYPLKTTKSHTCLLISLGLSLSSSSALLR